MIIVKKDGRKVTFLADKIQKRIEIASEGLKVDPHLIFKEIISNVADGMTTKELDELASRISANYITTHYDYSILATRIIVSRRHKELELDPEKVYIDLYSKGIVNKDFISKLLLADTSFIDHDLDYKFGYFAWNSLENIYLLRDSDNNLVETPQLMYLRVAVTLSDVTDNLDRFQKDIEKSYRYLSKGLWSPASPILMNAGTNRQNMISCELHDIVDDSTKGLLETQKRLAISSSKASGLGLSGHKIRSKSSNLSTGGKAGGLVKYAKILNETMRFWDQGGKRPGAVAVYLEPWHKDIFGFLDLKKETGEHNLRARDLFLALWIPDLFMERVMDDAHWTLFCPNDVIKHGFKPLHEIYGQEFKDQYLKLEELAADSKIPSRIVLARDVWRAIIESQIENGVPYMLYKDTINLYNMQSNLGTITSSNLCAEIVQYHDSDTIATCVLSSVVLQNFIDKDEYTNTKKLNLLKLHLVTKHIVEKLNILIDINDYTNKEAKKGAIEQRAIAIGVQGFADVLLELNIPFDANNKKCSEINEQIFKTIYGSAFEKSLDLGYKYGPYPKIENSHYENGFCYTDIWNHENKIGDNLPIRNSLLTAIMPTASSARIWESIEAAEPLTSLIYIRRVKDGEYILVNKHFMNNMIEEGIWGETLKNELIVNNGSLQDIDLSKYYKFIGVTDEQLIKEKSDYFKQLYRTAYEIPQKTIMDLAIQRSPYIDQSQSMNLFMLKPDISKLSSAHFYAWKNKLKTGMYYLRSKAINVNNKHLAISDSDEIQCVGCSA